MLPGNIETTVDSEQVDSSPQLFGNTEQKNAVTYVSES
jgi:hypothetical protein